MVTSSLIRSSVIFCRSLNLTFFLDLKSSINSRSQNCLFYSSLFVKILEKKDVRILKVVSFSTLYSTLTFLPISRSISAYPM